MTTDAAHDPTDPVRVLMLGWEFPPFISGGLGTACHGLASAMNRLAVDVLFVLPTAMGIEDSVQAVAPTGAATNIRMRRSTPRAMGNIRYRRVEGELPNPYHALQRGASEGLPFRTTTPLRPMAQPGRPQLRVKGAGAEGGYGGNLLDKIHDYAGRCERLTLDEQFDVIHAHDWITFPAGLRLAERTGKPLVAHVHATEFDRTGENVNQQVYEVERSGMHGAARVLTVSNLTRRIVVERYGVPIDRVEVVHNGIEQTRLWVARPQRRRDERTVLFLGRLTRQKGAEYFIEAAKRVLGRDPNVRFVVAGWGDQAPRLIEQVAASGLGHKVLFTGFLRGRDVDRAFRMADVYVMPSLSEPFGLTALEAIRNGAPVIVSKTSGVAEVLPRGSVKVDFWDVEAIADKVIDILRRPTLAESLRRHGAAELRELTWDRAARQCLNAYEQLVPQAETIPAPRWDRRELFARDATHEPSVALAG